MHISIYQCMTARSRTLQSGQYDGPHHSRMENELYGGMRQLQAEVQAKHARTIVARLAVLPALVLKTSQGFLHGQVEWLTLAIPISGCSFTRPSPSSPSQK